LPGKITVVNTIRFLAKNHVFIAALLLVALVGCTHNTPQAIDPSNNLLQILEGTFIGYTSNSDGKRNAMQDRRQRINAPEIGPHVMYWEVRTGPELKLYRQRLLTFIFDETSNVIIQRTWLLKSNDDWPEKIDANAFQSVTIHDIHSQLGELCVNTWSKKPEGWRAYLDPSQCRIWSERRQRFRRIEGESIITKASLSQAERGFTDDGSKQEFGTPPGEFHLLKRQ